MSGRADEGFGAHPFGEIARAIVAAQERSLELARAWTGSLQQLVADQAEGGRVALEALTTTLAATERAPASQRPSGAWSRAGTTPSCGCSRRPLAPSRGGPSGTEITLSG